MIYLKNNDNLYAYDNNSGLDLRYLDDESEWDLSDEKFKDLQKDEKSEIISENDAMKITAGNPPYQFIEEFMIGMGK